MPSLISLFYLLVVLAIFAFLQALLMLLDPVAREARGLRRRTLADGLSPWLAEILLTRRIADFEALIAGSGTRHSPARVLIGMGFVVVVGTLGLTLAGYEGVRSFAGGLIVGAVLPLLVLMRMRRSRLANLVMQLPDAIDTLVRSLRAGLPIPIGIRMIASDMPDPVRTEFRHVCDAMSYGLDLREALEQLARRLQVAEVKYMVAAIRIQYTSGGNLAEVLSSLSAVMRERVRFKMKVKALSAESRLSGNIMAAAPFLVVGGMFYLHPEFYKDVPGSPLLRAIMGGAAVLIFVGIVLMRRLVNIRA